MINSLKAKTTWLHSLHRSFSLSNYLTSEFERVLKTIRNNSPNRSQIQSMKRILKEAVHRQNYQACIFIADSSIMNLLDLQDYEHIYQIMRRAANKGDYIRQQLVAISQVLNRYQYQPTQEDAKFMQNLQRQITGDIQKDVYLFKYLNIPTQMYSKFFPLPKLESYCRDYAQKAASQPHLLKQKHLTNILKHYRTVIFAGLKANIWSGQFKAQRFHSSYFKTFPGCQRLFKLVSFACNPLSKIHIQHTGFLVTNTQRKIQGYLQDLGYNFKSGVRFSDFQVDFVINDKLILEYHGGQHFVLNRFSELTSKDKYKQTRLQQLGYTVCCIRFDQWQILVTKNKQYDFLVKLIEDKMLKTIQAQHQRRPLKSKKPVYQFKNIPDI